MQRKKRETLKDGVEGLGADCHLALLQPPVLGAATGPGCLCMLLRGRHSCSNALRIMHAWADKVSKYSLVFTCANPMLAAIGETEAREAYGIEQGSKNSN